MPVEEYRERKSQLVKRPLPSSAEIDRRRAAYWAAQKPSPYNPYSTTGQTIMAALERKKNEEEEELQELNQLS
jgi:hypothetical protein